MADEGGNCATETTTVSLPVDLLKRVDAIFSQLGYTSRAEYIRSAIRKQLKEDES